MAGVLLAEPSPDDWRARIVEDNVLQTRSPVTAQRVASLLRARLEPLGPPAWEMVRDGDRELAAQTCLAGSIQNSRLLGDFMDLAIREQVALFAKRLEPRVWTAYIEGCMGRDPEMPHWTESTIARLRSAVFSMLAEVGYVNNTRELRLQNVFIDPTLADYLRERKEHYVLRCLEVMS